MKRFLQIEGACVILRKGGSFTQNDVYKYGEDVFAKTGSSFVRLVENNGTSKAGLMWEGLDIKHKFGTFGHMKYL